MNPRLSPGGFTESCNRPSQATLPSTAHRFWGTMIGDGVWLGSGRLEEHRDVRAALGRIGARWNGDRHEDAYFGIACGWPGLVVCRRSLEPHRQPPAVYADHQFA